MLFPLLFHWIVFPYCQANINNDNYLSGTVE